MAINKELIGQIAFKQKQIFNRENYDFMDVPKIRPRFRYDAGEQIVFAFEVIIDQGLGGAGFAGDLRRRCRIEALGGEKPCCRF